MARELVRVVGWLDLVGSSVGLDTPMFDYVFILALPSIFVSNMTIKCHTNGWSVQNNLCTRVLAFNPT